MGDAPKATGTGMQAAFYSGFLCVLVLTFTPFKILGYLLPAIFTVWLVLSGARGFSQSRVLTLCVLIVAVPLFYMAVAEEFLITNYALALLTYSSFIPIIVLDGRQLASRNLLERCARACSTMVLIQGVFGTVQAIYGATQTGTFGGDNGDIVAGTIYPFLVAERAFSNPMFAVNMTLMILVSLAVPGSFAGSRRLNLFVGVVSLVLASVVHALVFLVVAVLFAWFFLRTKQNANGGNQRKLLVTVLLLSALTYVALPDSVGNISSVAEKAIDLDAVDIPRAILLSRVITDLPEEQPQQPFVGLGPGQFSSRASLIASGLYIGGPDAPKAVPFLTPQATRLANDYCFSVLIAFAGKGDVIGSSEQPFFSVLSVYTEFGAIGVFALALCLWRWLRAIRRRVSHLPELRYQAVLLVSGIAFFGLIGLQDNYWEAPQAILVGFLLLKVLYANVIYSEQAASS